MKARLLIRPRGLGGAWPLVVASALSWGCSEQILTGPDAVRLSIASAGSPDTNFYLYRGTKVHLQTDSSAFVFDIDLADPSGAVREALSGLNYSTLERVSQLTDHWLVRLPQRLSPGAHHAVLARLRRHANTRFAMPMMRTVASGTPVTLLNRMIVRFRNDVSRARIDSFATANGLNVVRPANPDSGRSFFLLSYPRGERSALAVVASLDGQELVEWAEPDKLAGMRLFGAAPVASTATTDPFFVLQYYLTNGETRFGYRVDINAQAAWTFTKGTKTTRVFVVDDGTDVYHQDLWSTGTADCPHNTNGSNDNGGLDTFPFGVVPGDYVFSPAPGDLHGTAITGIIAACHNFQGVAGIAPAVTWGAVRVFRNNAPNTDADIAWGIEWAWEFGAADVINASWGRSADAPSFAITQAIENAANSGRNGKGTIVVAAAGSCVPGEHCPVFYPANLNAAVAVGAIDRYGFRALYTPRGPEIDLVGVSSLLDAGCRGFGNDLVTTDLWLSTGGCDDGPGGDPHYTSTFGGTSAAAAQVSGVAALIVSLRPDLDRYQVISALLSGATPWGPSEDFGAGKLDAAAALIRAASYSVQPPPPSFTAYVAGPGIITKKGTYTWTAETSGGTGHSFQWSVYYPSTDQTFQLGSSSSQQLTVYAGTGGFEMRVTVSSGGQSVSASQAVVECIGQPVACVL